MKHTTLKSTLKLLTLSLFSAFVAVAIFSKFNTNEPKTIEPVESIRQYASMPISPSVNTDFTEAAALAVDAVVHVTVTVEQEGYSSPSTLFDFFFGEGVQPRKREVTGSGSGVIISKDGYIVTNNHVIDNSNKIKVVLNDNRSYNAILVGTDPMTDIALIKLQDTDDEIFPTLNFGNSEALKIGEWVLAVGNPFSLSTTVTAGIVSAKGRNMYNMKDPRSNKMSIESFIQTDAAVNPGNSGGALVNTSGQLIGINTAIASPTGSYAGYSFAVPSTIVKKVVADLMEYGEIKRAYMGVSINEINKQLAEDKDLSTLKGTYINGVSEQGAAKEAGIKEGDVIIAINDVPTNSMSEMQEQISRYRPGDEISITLLRKENKKIVSLVLRDKYGNSEIVKNTSLTSLGVVLQEVPTDLKSKIGLKYGVQVAQVSNGKLKQKGVKAGFIITKINNQAVKSTSDFEEIIDGVEGGLFLTGIYPSGTVAYYAINMGE